MGKNNSENENSNKKRNIWEYIVANLRRLVESAFPSTKMIDPLDLKSLKLLYPITMSYQAVFAGLLAYSIYSTYHSNYNSLYLAPIYNPSGQCAQVPVSITQSFLGDYNGNWESDLHFNLNSSVYEIEFTGLQVDMSDYQKALRHFRDLFSDIGRKASKRDLAWSLVAWAQFGSSYDSWSRDISGNSGIQYTGSIKFYASADSSIIYGQDIASFAFSNKDSVCSLSATAGFEGDAYVFRIPLSPRNASKAETNSYYYDTPLTNDANNYYEEPCQGIFNISMFYANKHTEPQTLENRLDVRSLALTLAINWNFMKMKDLELIVPSYQILITLPSYIESYAFYIDPYFAPMDPVLCFKTTSGDYFCVMTAKPPQGSSGKYSFYYPITSSSGDYNSTTCWVPKRFECPDMAEDLDIMIGFIFYNGDHQESLLRLIQHGYEMMLIMKNDPENGDITMLKQYFDALQTSIVLAEHPNRPSVSRFQNHNNANCSQSATEALNKSFDKLCGNQCSLLTVRLKSSSIFSPMTNKYYTMLRKGACNSDIYSPTAFEGFIAHSPTTLTQSYSICHMTKQQALLSAFGIAYGFSVAYAELFLFLLLYVSIRILNNFYLNPKAKVKPPFEKTEQNIRVLRQTLSVLIDSHPALDSYQKKNLLESVEQQLFFHAKYKEQQSESKDNFNSREVPSDNKVLPFNDSMS